MSKKSAPSKTHLSNPEPEVAPPKEEPAEPAQQVEQEGFGRWEYKTGLMYEGQWKLINGAKMRHGEGTLIFQGTTSYEGGREEYKGTWHEDKMQGYGVYKYTSGAIYTGEWFEGKQHGKGTYEFPDGTLYEGEWSEQKMHGEGFFIDKEGKRWEGEFVNGIFQSKMQKELKMEKVLKQKELDIKAESILFFDHFIQTFTKSDKKTFKENMTPLFAQEEAKIYVNSAFPKFEDRPPEKWNEMITFVKEFTLVNVLRLTSNVKILSPGTVLATQFKGVGQIVEFARDDPDRQVRCVICNTSDSNWSIVLFTDSVEPEKKKK